MRILLIDDDWALRAAATLGLGLIADSEVVAVDSGESALLEARKGEWDLFVLDVHMPGMGGVEVFEALSRESGTKDCPVIFLTGEDKQEEVDRLMAMGALGVISKPIDPMTLAGQVEDILRSRDEKGG